MIAIFFDIFYPFIFLKAAQAALIAAVSPVAGCETVTLHLALGRVLAEDLMSDRAVPPHDNAAMDGYAVAAADLAPDGRVWLPVAGRVAAGRVASVQTMRASIAGAPTVSVCRKFPLPRSSVMMVFDSGMGFS